MLFTKCILKEPSPQDGMRVSIMSRHTLNDGVTPDLRIKKFDIHMVEFAPSSKLIGSYYRKKINWKIFEESYLEELRSPQKTPRVYLFSIVASIRNITIMCIEDGSKFCHRRILAEECQRLEKTLRVEHR